MNQCKSNSRTFRLDKRDHLLSTVPTSIGLMFASVSSERFRSGSRTGESFTAIAATLTVLQLEQENAPRTARLYDGIAAMPLEIADSDAESDFDSPVKRPTTHQVGEENQPQSLASLPTIDFDEYLGPTQKLSSSASHYLNDFNQLDGSTDITFSRTADQQITTLFGEILPGMKSKKRAHSALQDGLSEPQHENSRENSKVKRSKTYGAASRSRTTQDDNLFAPPSECAPDPRNSDPNDQEGYGADQAVSDIHTKAARPKTPFLTGTSNQNGVIPLLERSLADSSHCMTTSTASMGQYQSINIDFRGSGQGLDVNTNPFGALSQVSFAEQPNQDMPENLTHFIEVDEGRSTHVGGNQIMVSDDEPLQVLSQRSPQRPLAIDPAQTMGEGGAASHADGDSHFQVPDLTNDIPDPATVTENVEMSMEKASVPRKRGRKARNSRLPSKSPAPSINEDTDDMGFSILATATRARRGTVESLSLSQASQTSATVPPSRKRKRRKSNQIDEEAPVGYPAGSSPSKHPTSELNLSDEAEIGLPKEAYKPRPSRTRSKRFVDEDETLLPAPVADEDHRTPAKNNSNNTLEQETPP
ncbi:hypothetical protein CLAIMM_09713 [Cladophialophora immunda]|nr:hypothetical protein CLAIMM_09713 [Cladophialophora immunda]